MKKESKEEIDIELKYRVLIIYDITDDRHRLKLGIRNDTPDKGTETRNRAHHGAFPPVYRLEMITPIRGRKYKHIRHSLIVIKPIRNDTPDKGTEIHIKYCVNRSVSVD